MKTKEQLDKNC